MRLTPILPLVLLPALIGCGEKRAEDQPLSPAAYAAVSAKPGVDREALARRVDLLFSDKAMGETRALIVMKDGRIVAERYGDGSGAKTPMIGWSMSKTVTAVMIGMLVSDGQLRLDQPAPVPAWQRPGDPRGEITLRMLLQMRSGLRHVEGGSPPWQSDEVRMLFLDGRDDMAKYAESQPLVAEPGTKFVYSTDTAVILADLAARVLAPGGDAEARRHAVSEYLRTRLFEPLGASSFVPEFDAAGTMVGGSAIWASPRDWAKFGEFLRNRGAVRGIQLVPRGWIDFMTEPSPVQGEYGGQTWLNRARTGGGEAALFPEAGPKDAFAALGHLGQYVIVAPSRGVTVVRLGVTPESKLHPVTERLGDVVGLFGARGR